MLIDSIVKLLVIVVQALIIRIGFFVKLKEGSPVIGPYKISVCWFSLKSTFILNLEQICPKDNPYPAKSNRLVICHKESRITLFWDSLFLPNLIGLLANKKAYLLAHARQG